MNQLPSMRSSGPRLQRMGGRRRLTQVTAGLIFEITRKAMQCAHALVVSVRTVGCASQLDTGYRVELITVRKLEFENDAFAFGDKLIEKWYPTVQQGNDKGLLLIATTAKDGAVTGGPAFMKVAAVTLRAQGPWAGSWRPATMMMMIFHLRLPPDADLQPWYSAPTPANVAGPFRQHWQRKRAAWDRNTLSPTSCQSQPALGHRLGITEGCRQLHTVNASSSDGLLSPARRRWAMTWWTASSATTSRC